MKKLINISLFLFMIVCTPAMGFSSCDLSFWTKLDQTGDLPPPLWDGASAYDEENELFYIFGGLNGTNPNDYPTKDFYVFNVQTLKWTNLSSATTPVARAEAMLWVDSKTGFVYLSGGRYRFRSGINLEYNTTHVYYPELKYWVELTQTIVQQKLANRSTEAIVIKKFAYAYAGSTSTLPAFINRPGAIQSNVIKFDSDSGWKNIPVEGIIPTPRAHHHLGYSRQSKAIFTYGGYTADPNGISTFSPSNYLSDLWKFDLNTLTWENITYNSDVSPGKRDNAKFLYVDSNELYLVGGADYTGANFIDLWRFDFATYKWNRVIVAAFIDPVTNQQLSPPVPIGAYYFTRTTNNGHEFWMFAGSASEFGGSLYNEFWKLVVPL